MSKSIMRFISFLRGIAGIRRLTKTKKISLGSILNKQVEKQPEKTLILFEDQKITYREFNCLANKYANMFLSINLKKGDTVALIMENRPEYLIIHAGLAKIGVVSALLNNNIREKQLIHALTIAQAKALIVGYEFIQQITDVWETVKKLYPGKYFWKKKGMI